MAKRIKRKLKPRFFLFLLVPVALAGVLIANKMKNPSHGRLGSDTVYGESELTGVIVRHETVIEAPDHNTITYLKSEAEELKENEPVAVLYTKGYDSVLGDIVARSQELYERQAASLRNRNEERQLPPEIETYNEAVTGMVEQMTRAAMNGEGDYLSLSGELLSMLETRSNYMNSLLPAEENIDLAQKYTAIAELRQKLNSYAAIFYHPGGGGFISFHLDGYENALNVESLTASQVRQIATSPLAGTVTDSALYRVVDPEGFYIALTVRANDAFRFVNGESYRLEVEHQDTVYTGRVIAEKTASQYVLYVMEIEADAFDVLENRTIGFTVKNTASGVSIPVEGLYFNGGVPYVYIYTGTSYEPVAVEILAADEKTAVIRAANKAIQLRSGLKFEYHEDIPAEG